ncbi:MAG: prepilin-type N-terminal cleavage/methylation domain-containing protein [Fimbriimonas sp.]
MKKAFTLIELLVVIAIIAILAAILFPVFAQAKDAAKKTASLSNIKQINLATQMYSADVDDMVPVALLIDGNNGWHTWAQTTAPYRKNWAMMYSPAGGPKAISSWMNIFTTPGLNWDGNWQYFVQYGYNASYLNPMPDCTSIAGGVFGAPISGSTAGSPAETVAFAESGQDGTEDNVGTWLVYPPGGFQATDVCTYADWGIATDAWYGINDASTQKHQAGLVRPRHAGGAGVSYLDGHAAYKKLGQIADGTTWRVGQNQGDAVIVDRNKYIWDLN